MSQAVKSLIIQDNEINAEVNDLTFKSARRLVVNSAGSSALNGKMLMESQSITALNTLSASTGSLTVQAKGTGSVILNHTSTATNEFELKTDGIVYMNDLPTVPITATNIDQMIPGRNFNQTYATSWTPEIYGKNPTGPSTTTFTTTTATGYRTRVGNLVFFTARIIVGDISAVTTSFVVRVKIPIIIPYTTAKYPQVIIINNVSGYRNITTNVSEVSASINFNGDSTVTQTNVDYASLYKKTSTSVDQIALTVLDLNTNGFQISYGGWYMIIP